MPLFTDGLLASTSDLAAVESTILATAASEALDLRQKLILGQAELGREISLFLTQQGFLAAGRDLSRVFANENLRYAHSMRTLALTFRDLASRNVHDRFELKARLYEASAARCTRQALETGIGITSNPVPAASGLVLRATAGGYRPARRLHVRAALTSGSGVTGAWSPTEVIDLEANQLAEVSVQPGAEPSAWVLYASYMDAGYERQTATGLPVSATWTEPATGLLTSLTPLPVQAPETYVYASQRLHRG